MTAATLRTSTSPPNRLGVNVFTAPAKAVVGERPRPFGEPLGWDPITSTLIYGEYEAVLVDAPVCTGSSISTDKPFGGLVDMAAGRLALCELGGNP
jgi:hypothetical protein